MGDSGENSREDAKNGNEVVAFQFGGYRLLAQQQRFEHNGAALPLTTKLYHLLQAFLVRPGQILSN